MSGTTKVISVPQLKNKLNIKNRAGQKDNRILAKKNSKIYSNEFIEDMLNRNWEILKLFIL